MWGSAHLICIPRAAPDPAHPPGLLRDLPLQRTPRAKLGNFKQREEETQADN